jgi:hypothetical protein
MSREALYQKYDGGAGSCSETNGQIQSEKIVLTILDQIIHLIYQNGRTIYNFNESTGFFQLKIFFSNIFLINFSIKNIIF